MNPESAASAIVTFTTSNDEHRKILRTSTPPRRPVNILSRTWDVWLTEGGRPGSASYVGPLAPVRVAAAADARKGLPALAPERRTADCEIGRSHLVQLAERAAKSNERRCIALWVASMMWASGALNGRGPWRTAEGLADDALGQILVQSHRALRSGHLEDAFVIASSIPGSGASCFTTWLWAASLGDPSDGTTALILNNRVRNGLASIDVRPSHSGAGYAAYVQSMGLAAATLRSEHGLRGATPEKLEVVLSSHPVQSL